MNAGNKGLDVIFLYGESVFPVPVLRIWEHLLTNLHLLFAKPSYSYMKFQYILGYAFGFSFGY